jgi:general secretion pathway protein K
MTPHRRHARAPRRQRGAALLTAMIIVTLVVTLAASMVWQQWRAVQVEVAERARAQSAWILSGALDFARLILKEDLRSGRPTALTEPWATPLAEARLSTFLAVDKSNTDDGPEAFLSGGISDMQARYNLTNLINQGKVDPLELAALERLCVAVGIETGVAQRIANGLRDATAPSANDGADAPLLPQSVAQLEWLGIDATSIQALGPQVALLPLATAVNVNTASREVLVAAIKGLDLATAERILQVRRSQPFKDMDAFTKQVSALAPLSAKLDVRSSYFEVRAKLRLADRVLVERSVVHRLPNGQVDVLRRERVASLEEVGS